MPIITRLQRSILPVLLLALSGCTIYSPPQGPAPIETRPEPGVVTQQKQPPVAPQPLPSREPNAVAAYSGLVSKARAASEQGDYNGALSLLERAQRIDPDSAEIYLELARTYAAQGQMEQARATAARGTLYCRSQSECEALRALAR
jgi:tetratricopeptide (TPR) repeat protein